MSTNKTLQHKKEMLFQLENALGNVSVACKSVGISRWSHYDWYKTDEDYRKQVDEISEVALDWAERKLQGLIDQGDTAATIFYLKTKGKRRGYVERQEMSGVQDEPITLVISNKI